MEGAAPAASARGARRILIVGPDQSAADRFVPLLRRASFEVHRMIRASGAQKLVGVTRFDLVVLLDPVPQADRFIAALRGAGSPSSTAGLLLLTGREVEDADRARVNRVLPTSSSEAEFERTVASLLEVRPRFEIRAWVRLQAALSGPGGRLAGYTVNVSTSGLLMRGCTPPPVGASVDFELALGSDPRGIRGRAEVVRHADRGREPEGSFALQFVDIDEQGRVRLDELLRSWLEAGRSAAGRGDGPAAAKRAELAALEERVTAALADGLAVRLRSPEWYLTGVSLGLESLAALQRISEEVYREAEAGSAAARSVAALEKVYRRFTEFAAADEVGRRVAVMLDIRPELELLLAEVTGHVSAGGDPGKGRGRTAVSRLTADVTRLLFHLRSLRNLRDEAKDLLAGKLVVLRLSRRQEIEGFVRRNRAFARSFGFESAEALEKNRFIRDMVQRIEDEISRVERQLGDIHRATFAGRFRARSSGDVESDLAEDRVRAVLEEVLTAGAEYLARAHSAYAHGLELTGVGTDALHRVAQLRRDLDRLERSGAPEGIGTV